MKTGQAGFTIVELLIAFSILAVLVVAVTPIFRQGNSFWQATQSQVELRQNLNSALQLIGREIRQAEPGTIKIIGSQSSDPNSQDIVTYEVYSNESAQSRGFSISGTPRHLNFAVNGRVTPITSTSLIDIEEATVYLDGTVYKISISGRYLSPNNIHPDDRVMTVSTGVGPRLGR